MRKTRRTARLTARDSSSCRVPGTEAMGRGTLPVALAAVLTGSPAAAQTDSVPTSGPQPVFQFSSEAGLGLRALWEQSLAAKQERVACLGASIRNDTVFVDRILALAPQEADSMSVSA